MSEDETKRLTRRSVLKVFGSTLAVGAAACAGDDSQVSSATEGTGGQSNAGTSGASNSAGSGGNTAGVGANAGASGSSGASGSGLGGTNSQGGFAGTAGTAGSSGTAGQSTGGQSGVGGSGGAASGTAGTGGTGQGAQAGTSGASGNGGTAGASGTSGAGGTGGAVPLCEETSSLSSSELLAPIQNIVVLMMENRSFDHYFGSLKLIEALAVEGLTGTESNPDPNGNQIYPFNLQDFTPEDPPHGWDDCHAQWNNGANDGFVIAHAGPSQDQVMGYHTRSQLSVLYSLADSGALCDHWYASVMGPTWPNRFYLHGGTSNGQKANLPAGFGFTSVFKKLDDIGVNAINYYHDIAWATGAYAKFSGNKTIETFFVDAANGTLPPFCIVDPQFFGAGANDDHPDHDVQLGQALIASVYAALANSPQWSQTLFVIVYDEHGGFFDHVPPPTTADDDSEFEQLGFRVPGIVLGPYAKRGCVVSTQFDHASVLKTVCTRFGITPWTARIAAANDLSSCIQPSYLSNPQPPVVLPTMTLSGRAIAERIKNPPLQRHPELKEKFDQMNLAYPLDRRSQGLGGCESVLHWGQKLGVIRIV